MFQKVLEFVGFWLDPNGYQPLASRIQGILEVEPLGDKKEVCTFNEMVNFIKITYQKEQHWWSPSLNLHMTTSHLSGVRSKRLLSRRSNDLRVSGARGICAWLFLTQDECSTEELSEDGQGAVGSSSKPQAH
eukprot:10614604-Ditylum_brightwellii.AAC.2